METNVDAIPIPAIEPITQKRDCPGCSQRARECVTMSFETAVADESVVFCVHLCWSCYRQLVKAMECLNKFFANHRVARAERIELRNKEWAREVAETDVLSCGLDLNKRIEIIKKIRGQFGLGLMEAKCIVDATYERLRMPTRVTTNGRPTTGERT